MTFRGIDIATQASPAVLAQDDSNIVFDGLNVHGAPGAWGGLGLMARNSSNVTVTNSQFYNLWGGIEHLDSTGVVISNNTLHDLEEDAIRGGGSSNITITGNYITNLYPQAGDHPDAVQFWGTTDHYSVSNITITNNVYVRGSGGDAQGIFIADGAYQNVAVSGNAIIGSLYNGILVSGTDGGVVKNNLVEGYVDVNAWIGVAQSNNVQITSNLMTAFSQPISNTNLTYLNNTIILPAQIGDTSALTQFEASSTSTTTTTTTSGGGSTTTAPAAVAPTPAYSNALFTLDVSGAATNKIMGSNRADYLNGSAANDMIDGRGGADTLAGGSGDDTYVVDRPTDVVVESANGGVDTVRSSVSSYALPANVENLTLVGNGGESAIGNELNNILRSNNSGSTLNGGAGNDILVAGKGADMLTGGTGKDIFEFDLAPLKPGHVTDFTLGDDMLDLRGLFSSVRYAGNDPVADHYLSLTSDGAGGTQVWFDSDGSGSAAAPVLVTTLDHIAPASLTMQDDWFFR